MRESAAVSKAGTKTEQARAYSTGKRTAPPLWLDVGRSTLFLAVAAGIHVIAALALVFASTDWDPASSLPVTFERRSTYVPLLLFGLKSLLMMLIAASARREWNNWNKRWQIVWRSDNLFSVRQIHSSNGSWTGGASVPHHETLFRLQAGSYNSSWLIVLNLRPALTEPMSYNTKGFAKLFNKARSPSLRLLIPCDSLPQQQYRHARVWMRSRAREAMMRS